MQFTLHLSKLIDYGCKTLGYPGELWTLKTLKLNGGYVAAAVYRHDLTFCLADGSFQTIAIVQK